MEIEEQEYNMFRFLFAEGMFHNQRLGQAFYDYFKLHKMADQTKLNALYNAREEQAGKLIHELFIIR